MKEDDKNFYKTTQFDWIFIALVLFFSIASYWVVRNGFQSSSQAGTILVYQNGRLLERDGMKDNKIISILDGRMQFEVKDARVRVLKTDCPHQICKNMGWIKHSGETIVCVPNRVLIEIKSKGPVIVDASAY